MDLGEDLEAIGVEVDGEGELRSYCYGLCSWRGVVRMSRGMCVRAFGSGSILLGLIEADFI